jgi:hypothetical protein
MTIQGLLDKVNRLNTDSIIEQAFDDTASDFVANQKEQLESGFDRNGNRLRKYASNTYARKKQAMNSKPGLGNPDLKLTGAFHRGIVMTANGNVVLTGSSDPKGPKLEEKYPTALGLGGPFKEAYLEDNLAPAIQRGITEVIGLKFG